MSGGGDRRWETDPPTGAPHRPGQVPTRCAGTCAIQAALVSAVVAAVPVVTMIAVAGDDGRLALTAVPVVLVVGGAGAAAVIVAVRRWGAAMTAELLAGYTTSTPTAGAWWLPVRRSDRPAGWVHWDWSAIEVRRCDGTVRTPATPGDPAPGFYASPHEPGRLELWTGSSWTRRYLDRPGR